MSMELRTVRVENPEELNLILGQSHFIKTVEDLHEVLAQSSAALAFGLAFCESSGPRLVRSSGNDDGLIGLAERNALAIGAGHSFIVFLRGGFPISVLNAIKLVPEVCRIFCATANPVEVVVGETDQGRAILGVVDGWSPVGVETADDAGERRALLRRFGYKL
jgi:adenosine/AMP kinase